LLKAKNDPLWVILSFVGVVILSWVLLSIYGCCEGDTWEGIMELRGQVLNTRHIQKIEDVLASLVVS